MSEADNHDTGRDRTPPQPAPEESAPEEPAQSEPQPQIAPPPADQPRRRFTARRARPKITLPSQTELDRLPAEVRMELRNQQRAERHQWLNSLGILFGVLFTAGTLVFTGLALRTAREDLRTSQDNVRIARESQFTDRYAKTLEALADDDITIRLGAIHALNRLLADSPRDRAAITAVLAGFTRNRSPAPTTKDKDLPDPSVDITAALTTLANNPYPVAPLDLQGIRTPYSDLGNARFNEANLIRAYLRGSNLSNADLSGATLNFANLSNADLHNANLTGASMSATDLRGASMRGASMRGADLRGARLTLDRSRGSSQFSRGAGYIWGQSPGTDLSDADLRGTDLSDADLRGADLRDADLSDADLRGANLRGARFSVSVEELRRVAVTDKTTRW